MAINLNCQLDWRSVNRVLDGFVRAFQGIAGMWARSWERDHPIDWGPGMDQSGKTGKPATGLQVSPLSVNIRPWPFQLLSMN